jgi:hypothetical protein
MSVQIRIHDHRVRADFDISSDRQRFRSHEVNVRFKYVRLLISRVAPRYTSI